MDYFTIMTYAACGGMCIDQELWHLQNEYLQIFTAIKTIIFLNQALP